MPPQYVRMGLLTRRPDLGAAAFRRHWRDVHGPLAARLPGLRRYAQNSLGAQVAVRGVAAGDWRLDGISALWFAAGTDMGALSATPAYQAVAADEPRCMLPSRIIVAERHVLLPEPAPGAPAAKVMALLAGEASGLAAAPLRGWPGLIACTLSVVTARMTQGATLTRAALPVDAVAELWFAPGAPADIAALPGVVAATAWHATEADIVRDEGAIA